MSNDKHLWFVRSWGHALTITVIVFAICVAVLGVFQAREQARRQLSSFNLSALGNALENYHDTHGAYPPGGVFSEDGVPIQDWSAQIDPYLWQNSWYSELDTTVAWDDPVNLDKYITRPNPAFFNPNVSIERSPDRLPLNHYAANQCVFHRNSTVSVKELSQRSSTVLLGESNGNYPPRGYPYNWRDVTLGLKASPDGFGSPTRNATLFVMADLSVKEINANISPQILNAYAGPAAICSPAADVEKPSEPYRVGDRNYWRYFWMLRCHKGMTHIRLSPDGSLLEVNFDNCPQPEDLNDGGLSSPDRRKRFQRFVERKPIQRIVVKGSIEARELEPLIDIVTLRELDLSSASIIGNSQPILNRVGPSVQIDQ